MDDVPKFPRTPHLFRAKNANDRTDLCLNKEDALRFLSGKYLVQEKLDGNCVGFGFDSSGGLHIKIRGEEIREHTPPEFRQLNQWGTFKQDELFDLCEDKRVLYGEWLFWKHTVGYDSLPSYFVVHDVYDKEKGKFWSVDRIKDTLEGRSFSLNPVIGTSEDIGRILLGHRKSQYGPNEMEGYYFRKDFGDFNVDRGKIVFEGFYHLLSDRHWKEMVRKVSSLSNSDRRNYMNNTTNPEERALFGI